jgi:cytochrome c-type biogenesis protein CcmF
VFFANICWIVSALVLIISLIYPVYYSYVSSAEVAIDPEYYFKVFAPIFIVITFIAALVKKYENIFRVAGCTIIGLACSYIIHTHATVSMVSFLLLVASIILLCTLVLDFGGAIYNDKFSIKFLAFFLGHFGFGLLIFAVVLNHATSKGVIFSGKIGDEVVQDNMRIRLADIKIFDTPTYYSQTVFFTVQDPHGHEFTLYPENRLYKTEKSLSAESDIYSFLSYDIYAVVGKIRDDVVDAQIYYRPFMSLIWLSAFLIVNAFLFGLARGTNYATKSETK